MRADVADDACMERTGADEVVGRTGAERAWTIERTGRRGWKGRGQSSGRANGRKRCGRGPVGADGRKRRRRGLVGVDGRTGEQAVERTSGLGGRGIHCADWAVGGGRAVVERIGRTGRLAVCRSGRRVDGRMGGRAGGPGFKRPHSMRPISRVPSPLALSERECVGCLGVQWSPVGFHVNHPYLAPGLPCLV